MGANRTAPCSTCGISSRIPTGSRSCVSCPQTKFYVCTDSRCCVLLWTLISTRCAAAFCGQRRWCLRDESLQAMGCEMRLALRPSPKCELLMLCRTSDAVPTAVTSFNFTVHGTHPVPCLGMGRTHSAHTQCRALAHSVMPWYGTHPV